MDKYQQAIAQSAVQTDEAEISAKVKALLDKHFVENNTRQTLLTILGSIDLTSLHATDSQRSIGDFVERVNAFAHEHADLPNVAGVCVYPNFVPMVRTVLDESDVNVVAVSGGFPSGQTFTEVKVAEVAMAAAEGADEIDVVFDLGDFFDKDYEEACDQLEEMKHSARDASLKVILETGALKTARNIRDASILALYSGADFIKTSTGKEYPGATPEAVYVMCQCIREYYEKTGRMVGIKIAGGVATPDDAVRYYTIVKETLGDKWLETNEYFRIGASRLANSLVSAILGEEAHPF